LERRCQQDTFSLEDQGASGYLGATYHFDLDGNNLIDASFTFAGLSTSEINTLITLEVASNVYLFFGT
jgi:hypothetical protein